MRNKTVNSRDLAKFFAENIEKENIVDCIPAGTPSLSISKSSFG